MEPAPPSVAPEATDTGAAIEPLTSRPPDDTLTPPLEVLVPDRVSVPLPVLVRESAPENAPEKVVSPLPAPVVRVAAVADESVTAPAPDRLAMIWSKPWMSTVPPEPTTICELGEKASAVSPRNVPALTSVLPE